MQRTFEAWETEDGFAFFESAKLEEQRANPAQTLVRRVFQIEASTFEEAMSIYSLRMGWGPYRPMGEPAACSNCGSWLYPEGSGECWQCGKIC
ncbi:hypothetical protein [Ramlibacter pallidus]|uniref:Uncharacterized protein n=1 Tax=Ramlibacter pallidus TaxID=2780087 RepID=A0ABR9S6J7_9BURK|nr:hypothetical protein [Ramlibacter pallidus]MBE7368689.1 hypothetical protein [Ramlibacter pallidus]